MHGTSKNNLFRPNDENWIWSRPSERWENRKRGGGEMRNYCKEVTQSLPEISTKDPYKFWQQQKTFCIGTTSKIPILIDATTKVRADETCRSLFCSSRVPFSWPTENCKVFFISVLLKVLHHLHIFRHLSLPKCPKTKDRDLPFPNPITFF